MLIVTTLSSASSLFRYMDEVERMADWLVQQLTTLGATAEKRDIGTHELAGKQVKLPSVVIGQLGNDPKKVHPNSYRPTYLTR
jgi:Cys-Gly metallodipeptidase DUG1